MGKLVISSRTEGDVKVTWDPKVESQVNCAKGMFDDLVAKGYLAYNVSDETKKRKALRKFDAEAGEIFMAPPLVGG